MGWLQGALEQADAEVAFLLLACQNIHALLPSYSGENKDVCGSEVERSEPGLPPARLQAAAVGQVPPENTVRCQGSK